MKIQSNFAYNIKCPSAKGCYQGLRGQTQIVKKKSQKNLPNIMEAGRGQNRNYFGQTT